jgi:hypothetical protein
LSGGINLGIQETLAKGVRAFGKGAYDSWQDSAEWVSQQPVDLTRGGTVGIAPATMVVIRSSTGDGSSVVDGHDFRFRYTVQPSVTLTPTAGSKFPQVVQPADPDSGTSTAWNLTEWINVTSSGTTKLGPGDVVGAGYYPTGVEGLVRAWWWDSLTAYVFFESNPMTSWAQEARLGSP